MAKRKRLLKGEGNSESNVIEICSLAFLVMDVYLIAIEQIYLGGMNHCLRIDCLKGSFRQLCADDQLLLRSEL